MSLQRLDYGDQDLFHALLDEVSCHIVKRSVERIETGFPSIANEESELLVQHVIY